MSGCSLASDESARKIVDVIVANHLGELGFAIAWRSLVGAFLGLGIGMGCFFLANHYGAFRWGWEHAKWVRIATGAAYGVTFAGALGWFGFWQGTLHGTERVVREGQLASDVLPPVGEAGSTLLAAVYVGSELTCEQDQPIDEQQATMLAARIDGYVADEWRMDVETLRERIADVRGCVLALGIEEAERQIHERYPELEGTVGDDIVPWVLDRIADQLVASLAENDRVEEFSAPIVDTFARLDQAAGRDGEPDLSHRELSDHLVKATVIPMILLPVEHVADGQKKAGLLAIFGILLISIGLFRLADYLYERRAYPPA